MDKQLRTQPNLKPYLAGLMVFFVAPLLVLFTASFSIHAQESSTPYLRIESISTNELPIVRVLFSGGNLNRTPSELALAVREDGIDRPVISFEPKTLSLQIALLLDPALDLSLTGNSGDSFQGEITDVASSLVESGVLSARSDWLSAFAQEDGSNEFGRITNWQHDHQGVVNQLYQLDSAASRTDVQLGTIFERVFADFDGTPVTDASKPVIVLFTDGTSVVNDGDVTFVVGQARDLGASVNVIMLGDASVDSRENLEQIAAATGGRFTAFENRSSVAPIWARLEGMSNLYEISYRIGKAQPSQIAISIEQERGEEVVATEDFPQIYLAPVQVVVRSPAKNAVITRTGKGADIGLAELEPRSLGIQLDFEWPDGVQRDIKSVEITIGDSVVVKQEPPFTTFEMPIIALDAGTQLLRATVTDEFGITGEVVEQLFRVEVVRSEIEPEQTPVISNQTELESSTMNTDAVAVQSVSDQQRRNEQGMNILGIQLPETVELFGVTFLVNGITLLIALFPLIFLLALLLYWLTQRSEKEVEQDYGYYEYDNNGYFYRFEPSADDMQLTQPQVNMVDTEDDLTMPVQLPSFYTNADAYLVYVSGGEHLPKKLPIEANEPVRLGRKKSFCDQVIDDQRVSRLHSIITNEGGNFFIKDEGSSGGTFVNRRKLSTSEKHLLKNNDIVNFNEVEYRFEISAATDSSTDESLSSVSRPEPLLPNLDYE